MIQRRNRRGQGLTEYFLILVLVGLMGLVATDKVGKETARFYEDTRAKVVAAGN